MKREMKRSGEEKKEVREKEFNNIINFIIKILNFNFKFVFISK